VSRDPGRMAPHRVERAAGRAARRAARAVARREARAAALLDPRVRLLRGVIVRTVLAALGATVLMLVLTSVAPHHGRRLIAGWLVVLAFLVTRVLLHALLGVRVPGGSAFDAALLTHGAAHSRPEELDRLRRLLVLASASGAHAHSRLRPLLRVIAADRLAWRHGLRLDGQPEAARRLLGEAAWELVRPDAPPVDDRYARGPSPGAIDEAIRALEAL